MTILSGFDTYNPDYKSGNFICPRCGMIHVIDSMEIKPASQELEDSYQDIKKECGYDIPNIEDLKMNICSNCGLMWMDNDGVYSTSQLISYLFTSMIDVLDFILDSLEAVGEDAKIRDEMLKSLKTFYTDNNLDSDNPVLQQYNWSSSEFTCFVIAHILLWLNRLLRGASPDDIVDIYNSWIDSLGKYAKDLGCTPISGRIDAAITPYVDEVEKIDTDKMEVLNDE